MRSDPRERTVLVVEDDEAVRSIVETHLRKRRFKVRAVSSAEEVLADLRDRKLDYDLALVDVHLPAMSGVELSRLLLAARPLSAVLIITGDDDAGLAREALNGGGHGLPAEAVPAVRAGRGGLAGGVHAGPGGDHGDAGPVPVAGSERLGESGGSLPRSWLHVGDEQSGAGAGHGARVVSIAGLLAKKLGDERDRRPDRDLLRTAARTHEIGRITGGGSTAPGGAADRAAAGGPGVRWRGVRDGAAGGGAVVAGAAAGGPGPVGGGRAGPRRGAAGGAGAEAPEAMEAAIDALETRSGDAYDPTVVGLLREQREQVESMWVLQRQVDRR
jgi:CheY-like chemotaxis protein